MSAIFTYTLYLSSFVLVLAFIIYGLRNPKKIKDIKVNALSVFLSFIFVLIIIESNVLTLTMADKGIFSLNYLVPNATSGVYSIAFFSLFIALAFATNYFFFRINSSNRNKKHYKFHRFLLYSQLLGLIIFTLSSLALAIYGINSHFLNLYIEGIYHSTIPIILVSQIVLVFEIK